MTLTDHDTDRITAALERARSRGTVPESELCKAVYQEFRGLYTLEQVELVQAGVFA